MEDNLREAALEVHSLFPRRKILFDRKRRRKTEREGEDCATRRGRGSIPIEVFGPFGDEAMFPPLLSEDGFPEFARGGIENQFH